MHRSVPIHENSGSPRIHPATILGPADLGRAWDTAALFGRSGPLLLEIGFGNGEFLLHLARAHPECNVIGAELSPGSLIRAHRALRNAGASNVVLFRGHARLLLREGLLPNSLTCVYVNFPDPWPKDRHTGQRLLRESFLRVLSSRLVASGQLLFTTDHPSYFEQVIHDVEASGLFRAEIGTPPPAALKTKYARKWRAQNKPIHHLSLIPVRRVDEASLERLEIEPGMHFAYLSGTLPEPQTFEKRVQPFPGGCAVVLDVLRATRGVGLTFLVRVEELDLVQEILVEATPRDALSVRVGVRPFGQPLPTRGTREAVALVTAWLGAQGLEIIERSF